MSRSLNSSSDWISELTGKSYRLLSEAEWEYAARAGTQTAYSWGDDIDKGRLGEDAGIGLWGRGGPKGPVALFSANAFGLYAMHGNVWEWVEDCYHDNYNGAPTDGSAWTTGDCNRRVIRSGSWTDDLQRLRSASRRWNPVATLDDCIGCFFNVGFRLGRTLTP